MRDFRNAVLAGIALVVCSLALYSLAPTGDPLQGYVLIPGVIVGMYVSMIASGNPHGGSLMVMLVVASFVNCFFYAVVTFSILRFCHRSSKSKG